MIDYQAFLQAKRVTVPSVGFEVSADLINPKLFKFQRDIVRWALHLGRAALFANVGLGKTGMQLEWARWVAQHTGRPVLILAPLAVAPQTVREGQKFGIEVYQVQQGNHIDIIHQRGTGDERIFITNYDNIHKFDVSIFAGIVLDESSILKHYSKTFFALVEMFMNTPYKLCCTATPAPNDFVEFGNHAMFLGIMHFKDMLARWFVGEGDIARKARLKHHAEADFWRWLTSWAVCISKPSDLGDEYDMPGYDLPALNVVEHRLAAPQASIDRAWSKGQLLPDDSTSATQFHKVKRESLPQRVEKVVQIIERGWGFSLADDCEESKCGSLNMLKPANKNTKMTQMNELEDANKAERQKKTQNTCEHTTANTRKSSRNTPKNTEMPRTPHVENDTKTTQNTAKKLKPRSKAETRNLNSTDTYDTNSELTSPPTSQSLNPKTGAVPFAEQQWETSQGEDSMLTTVTKLELSEDYYAPTAILDLANSETTLNYSVEQSNISLNGLNPYIVWCHTDYEQRALEDVLGDYAISVFGSLSPKEKENRVMDWLSSKKPILISKPSILGMGLNMQLCNQAIYVGVDFSFETTFQSMGRIYRYGQQRDVYIDMIYAETEGNVLQILQSKQIAFQEMQAKMSAAMREHGLFRDEGTQTMFSSAGHDRVEGDNWTFYLGDCIEVMAKLPDNSIDLTVTSIPFSNLYIYSDSEADVGNAADKDEFFEHMKFVIRELLRITTPGRCCAVHVKDLPLFQNRDGVQGIDPFSDDTVAAFRREGWTLQSRVTIEKDPVIEMQKTNSHGLLFMNWKAKAELLRTGLPDYLLVFQKPPGEGEKPVKHDARDRTYYGSNPPAEYRYPTLPSRKTGEVNEGLPIWQEYANPNWSDVVVPMVWADVNQTDVLNFLVAKGDKDERHICPLQLDLIARVIQWKSNPGDVVFDPFGGIGSSGYKALEMKRKFVGAELKPEYHRLGVKYLREAEFQANMPVLFDEEEMKRMEGKRVFKTPDKAILTAEEGDADLADEVFEISPLSRNRKKQKDTVANS